MLDAASGTPRVGVDRAAAGLVGGRERAVEKAAHDTSAAGAGEIAGGARRPVRDRWTARRHQPPYIAVTACSGEKKTPHRAGSKVP